MEKSARQFFRNASTQKCIPSEATRELERLWQARELPVEILKSLLVRLVWYNANVKISIPVRPQAKYSTLILVQPFCAHLDCNQPHILAAETTELG